MIPYGYRSFETTHIYGLLNDIGLWCHPLDMLQNIDGGYSLIINSFGPK